MTAGNRETRHDVDCRRADQDKDVAADDRTVTQKGTGKWLGNGCGKDAAHREHDESGDQHQLVGDGIEDRAEL